MVCYLTITNWYIVLSQVCWLFFFIFFLICSEFCHTLKWNSHGFTCVPHPDPPSLLPLHLLPLGLPSAPGLSACLMYAGFNARCSFCLGSSFCGLPHCTHLCVNTTIHHILPETSLLPGSFSICQEHIRYSFFFSYNLFNLFLSFLVKTVKKAGHWVI